jgi:prepilin-type N-terminal cleavage/methylation domain-containing protein
VKRKGFTVVELVIVLLVAGILAVVAGAAISSAMKGIQLSSAADRLASDLRYAQTLANNTGTWYGISFEVHPLNQYTIYTTNGTVDTIVENPAKLGSLFIINLENEHGVRISSAEIAGGNKVEFSPLGTPYNDKMGTALSNEGVVTLARDSAIKTVRITPNTGRIYIQ